MKIKHLFQIASGLLAFGIVFFDVWYKAIAYLFVGIAFIIFFALILDDKKEKVVTW